MSSYVMFRDNPSDNLLLQIKKRKGSKSET